MALDFLLWNLTPDADLCSVCIYNALWCSLLAWLSESWTSPHRKYIDNVPSKNGAKLMRLCRPALLIPITILVNSSMLEISNKNLQCATCLKTGLSKPVLDLADLPNSILSAFSAGNGFTFLHGLCSQQLIWDIFGLVHLSLCIKYKMWHWPHF